MTNIEIAISSPPDRERLVAEIFIDHELIAEIKNESGEPDLELYPRRDGQPWRLNYLELRAALDKAAKRLADCSPPP